MGKNLLERRARIKENRKVTKGGFEGEKNRGKTYWKACWTLGNLSWGTKGEY